MKKYTLMLDGKSTGLSYKWEKELTETEALKEIAGRMNMFDLKDFSVKISECK